jgi:hypothetical protein
MNDLEFDNYHESEFLKDNTKTGRMILSLGKKNSGKSYLMMAYLKYVLYHKVYEAIHFVCPIFSGEQNNSYDFLKTQKHILIYKHYSEAVSKAVDKSRQTKHTLFMIDDATSELMQNNDQTFIHLICTTRHYKGLTLWANVHSCKRILTPAVRQNIDNLFIYHIPNIKLLNDIYDEYLSLLFESFKDFKIFYVKTLDEEHSCIFYSTHIKGIDSSVKHWDICKKQDYILQPTKAPEKPKPKIDKQKFTGASISSILFNKKRRK